MSYIIPTIVFFPTTSVSFLENNISLDNPLNYMDNWFYVSPAGYEY